MKGTYVLIAFLRKDSRIKVGRLGAINFKKGYYCYVGSAFGPGGLERRIGRYRRLNAKRKGNIRWHIDFFLVNPNASIKKVVVSRMGECSLSKKVGKGAESIRGFGCSDCSCKSHMYYFKRFGKMNLNHIF